MATHRSKRSISPCDFFVGRLCFLEYVFRGPRFPHAFRLYRFYSLCGSAEFALGGSAATDSWYGALPPMAKRWRTRRILRSLRSRTLSRMAGRRTRPLWRSLRGPQDHATLQTIGTVNPETPNFIFTYPGKLAFTCLLPSTLVAAE